MDVQNNKNINIKNNPAKIQALTQNKLKIILKLFVLYDFLLFDICKLIKRRINVTLKEKIIP